jgi:hypothetical protein
MLIIYIYRNKFDLTKILKRQANKKRKTILNGIKASHSPALKNGFGGAVRGMALAMSDSPRGLLVSSTLKA